MTISGFQSLEKKIETIASDLEDDVADAAHTGAQDVASEARSNVLAQNAVWTGNLVEGIYAERSGSRITINSEAPYSGYVEYGTGGHSDAVDPRFTYRAPNHTPELTREITEWVMTKPMFFGPRTGAVAWAIAQSISEEGTEAHPFWRPAWFRVEPQLRQQVQLAFKKTIRRA